MLNPLGRPGTLLFCGLALFAAIENVYGQFTNIVNIPPDPNIGDDQSIGSDTQLNLFDGGEIGRAFLAGARDVTNSNIEVNIFGGSVGGSFVAYNGSTMNVSSGSVGSFSANNGSNANISGGSILGSGFANAGSTVNISGGSIGESFYAREGSTVNISGGNVGVRSVDIQGEAHISGGSVGYVRAHEGSNVNIFGGEFRLDGVLIAGLETVGNSLAFNLPDDSVLSGTLADGNSFAFSPLDFDAITNGTLTLTAASLPPIGPSLITLPADPTPPGVRNGQTLVIEEGAVVPDNFNAGLDGTVVISGGQVGNNFEAVGAQVNISGGSVGLWFDAFPGSKVNISGGSVGEGLQVFPGGMVNITGGSLGPGSAFEDPSFLADGGTVNISGGSVLGDSEVKNGGVVNISGGTIGYPIAYNGSTVNISGGIISGYDAEDGGTLNVSGGYFVERSFAAEGSAVNLFGTQFVLGGMDITDSLNLNESMTVELRDVTLSGLLADGSTFEFGLNSDQVCCDDDYIDPAANLTITLVQPGDTNADGLVNIEDLNSVRNNFGTTGNVDGTLVGDAVPWNGVVDIDDLNAVRNNFGAGTNSAVPEPNGLFMAILAAFVAVTAKRMPRRAAGIA